MSIAIDIASGRGLSRPGNVAGASVVHQVRTFVTLWNCDSRFREDLSIDCRAAAAARGFDFDPEELRMFWDPGFRHEVAKMSPEQVRTSVSPIELIWIELRERAKDRARKVRIESVPADPRFAAWRERQILRCNSSFSAYFADSIPHIPFAVELSKGCSVGCWFCAVSAPRLDGHFGYTAENADSFRSILRALARVTGRPAGRWGVLFWATEPFDHPDYERFCLDFAEEFGAVPITTTAQGWKDMLRTRKFISFADAHGRSYVRLSVLNLRILDRYLSELSPSDLADVTFVPVNRESVIPTTKAGRARLKWPRHWPAFDVSKNSETSISPMSGFLLNLVERSVKLISPCPSSEQWPDGYFVHDQDKYEHATELPAILEQLIERNMSSDRAPVAPHADQRLVWNPDRG
jgi:radical SAM family RiPP maturation amino acid epimerase